MRYKVKLKKYEAILKHLFGSKKLNKETFVTFGAVFLEYFLVFVYSYLTHSAIAFQLINNASSFSLVLVFAGLFGAWLCGHIGDRLGRKKILVWTISVIAITFFLLSIIPTYFQAGSFAIIAFIILRLLQTVALGGDFIGLATFILEEAPKHRRGLFSGLLATAGGLGVAVSSWVIAGLDSNPDATADWLWRLPISLGILGLLFAQYFFRVFGETSAFSHCDKKLKVKWPIVEILKKHKLQLLHVVFLSALVPIMDYVVYEFNPNFGVFFLHLRPKTAMAVDAFGLVLYSISAPIFGYLSDRFSQKIVLMYVSSIILVFSLPLFLFIEHAPKASFFLVQSLFILISSAYYAVALTASINLVPILALVQQLYKLANVAYYVSFFKD